MKEVTNFKCVYEIELHHHEYKLYCFDLTINRGAKLMLGTVALVYPTESEAVADGEEWMRLHAQSSPDEIKRLLCRVKRQLPSIPRSPIFGVGITL